MARSSDIKLAGLTREYLESAPGIDTPGAGAEIRLPDGSARLVAGSGQHRRSCKLRENNLSTCAPQAACVYCAEWSPENLASSCIVDLAGQREDRVI